MNGSLRLWEYATTLLIALSGGLVWQLMTLRGQSRRGAFFGARAEPGFRESAPGRAILRQFRLRVWGWTLMGAAVCVAAMACVPVTPPPVFSDGATPNEVIVTGDFDGSLQIRRDEMVHHITVAAPFIGFLAGMAAFALAHRRTRREAVTPAESSVRMASLAVEDEPESLWLDALDWLAMLVPPAIPLWSLAILALHRHDTSPVFSRTQSTYMAIFGLAIGLGCCTASHWALRYRSRSSDWAPTPGASHKFRTYLGVMQACVWTFILAELSGLVVMQVNGDLRMPPFGLSAHMQYLVLAIWVGSLWGMRWWLTKHMATGSGDSMADRYWKWGVFYVNHDDSAIVVQLRSGLGLSYNYARPSVLWVAFAVTAVIVIGVADAFRL